MISLVIIHEMGFLVKSIGICYNSRMLKKERGGIPSAMRPLFWSYEFEKLDPEKDKRLIIMQVINYGNWEDWKWLLKNYGREEIKKAIQDAPASSFRPQALKLITLLLEAAEPKYASRSAR